ncbi:hypothetical protein DMENIID0001_136860 [Sergentomyia squamirostris]
MRWENCLLIICLLGVQFWGRSQAIRFDVVGYTNNNARVYQVGTKQIYLGNWRVNWHQAYSTCRSLGMQMVTIESDADNRNLWEFVNSQNVGECWLGGTDLGSEGTWTWFPTGRQFAYSNWAPLNPNNLGGQHCLQFWTRYPAFWDDDHCWREKFFMCENIQCSAAPVQIQLHPSNVQGVQTVQLQPGPTTIQVQSGSQPYQVQPAYHVPIHPVHAVHQPASVHLPAGINGAVYVYQ